MMNGPSALRDLFDRAVSLPAADRAEFLHQVCGDDAVMRWELERLLAAHDRLGSILDTVPTRDTPDLSRRISHGRTPALPRGVRLGRYEITGALGAGGMGDVYKARDTRLDRIVAIKVLPHDLTHDLASQQRFEREARVVAALSHAHICGVFDVGREGDTDYLVMEYVDGETLAARLQRGRLPVDQALTYGLDIADALLAAHRAGIVHRDLKPGNIMLSPGGAKLLDFGLAKRQRPAVVGDAGAGASTLTQTGTILGTVQYMAPEQLEGREADERTDIFAFGVLLYEMVTARRAFEAESDAALIGQILHRDPPALSSVEGLTPPALDELVRRCMAKAPFSRPQSMSEVHTALLDLRGKVAEPPAWRNQWLLRVAVFAVLLAASASAWERYRHVWHRPSNGSATAGARALTPLTYDNVSSYATFSPDGRFVLYNSGGQLWVRPTAGGNPVQITHSGINGVADWSPDGTIAVEREEGLFTMSPLGGDERRVATFNKMNGATSISHLPTWSPDGKQILFATEPFSAAIRLFLVAPDQPPRQILADFLQGGDWRLPAWHPDGRITIAGRHRTAGYGIYTISPADGRWVKTDVPAHLLDGTIFDPSEIHVLSWAPSGQFLYATCDLPRGIQNIWRLRMDPALRITATDRITVGPGSDWSPKVSRDGKRLLFTVITGNSRLWSFPFKGGADEAVGAPQPISEEDGEINWASVSRDGRRLAYYYKALNAPLRQSELRLSPLPADGAPERIPADRYVRMASAWSHRGDRLAIQAAELSTTGTVVANLLIVREQERGVEHIVGRCESAPPAAACNLSPVDWTADDTGILVTSRLGNERRSRLSLWSASEPAVPAEAPLQSLVADPARNISQGAYSPDGRWLAFAYGGEYRDEKGIAIVPAAGNVPSGSWRAVAEGFEETGNPLWSPDGHLLYFTSSHASGWMNVWRVGMTPSTGSQDGLPEAVTALPASWGFLVNRSYYPRIALGTGRVILPMNSQKSTVWMLDNVDR